MNDYWNDPPEIEEVPECCNEVMHLDDFGNCSCNKCGKVIKQPEDPKPEDYLITNQ